MAPKRKPARPPPRRPKKKARPRKRSAAGSTTASAAFADEVLRTVGAVVVVLDPQGRIQYFNPAAEHLTGYRAAEVQGKAFWDLFLVPSEVPRVKEIFASLSASRFPHQHENFWRTRSGELKWIHWSNSALLAADGTVSRVIATGIDATERTALERRLTRAELSFVGVVQGLPVAVVMHRKGVVTFTNEALRLTLGRDVVGSTLTDLVHPEDRAAITERLAQLAVGAPSPGPIDVRLRTATGGLLPCELTSVVAELEGEPTVIEVFHDLTPRQEVTAHLVQLDRMATLGTIAAGVGHEINNPLTYILANLEQGLLLFDEDLLAQKEELRQMLSDALVGANKVRDIVADLKLLTRDKGPSRSIDVNRLLDSALDIAAHEVRHRAQVTRQYGQLRTLAGQESRLAQVFLNLIVNAAQATPSDTESQGVIEVRTREEDDWVVVDVEDHGPGMTPDVVEQLFQPFFTTKVGGGTGLGLAISRQIVTAHRGTLTVRSTPGKGSVFTVRLPVLEVDDALTPAPRLALSATPQSRLLVIDDDQLVSRSLTRVLKPTHEVVATTDARQALEWLARGDPFDAVLCDVMMPGMNGVEFYRELERRDPRMAGRVLFITGGAFTPDAARFLEEHKDKRVDKPIQRELLGAMLARLPRVTPLPGGR